MHQVGWAIVVVILAGIIQGSFAAPMKRMPEWHWENSWLVFALSGLLIFPWIVAVSTVPHLSSVFLGASGATLFKVIAFGFAWGIGATLFGLGISRVGLALGFALILGITATFGSLLPLAVLHPEELMAKRGLALIAGTAVMIVGLIFLALAGSPVALAELALDPRQQVLEAVPLQEGAELVAVGRLHLQRIQRHGPHLPEWGSDAPHRALPPGDEVARF